ncbi:MAG: acyl-CoA thioesterase [Anaerolineae bacterium]|nr:acyl-CoA thioesterase [Anaerolineae bacterium]
MQDLLAHYPVVIEIPVAWGEMDALGHVNNIVYFRYFESGRIAYFRQIDFIASPDKEVGPILGSINCKFKYPITFPDTVSVGVRTIQIEEDRLVIEHCVVSHAAQRIAAQGEGVVVAYDYRARKKTTLPAEIKQRIQALEDSVRQSTR